MQCSARIIAVGTTNLPHADPVVRQSFPLQRPAVSNRCGGESPMKPLIVCAGLFFAATTILAQPGTPKKPAATPPAKAEATTGGHQITIAYSAPGVKGREGKI